MSEAGAAPAGTRRSSTRSKARKRALDILFEAELRGTDPLATLAERTADADAPVRDYTADPGRGACTPTPSHRRPDRRRRSAAGWTLPRTAAGRPHRAADRRLRDRLHRPPAGRGRLRGGAPGRGAVDRRVAGLRQRCAGRPDRCAGEVSGGVNQLSTADVAGHRIEYRLIGQQCGCCGDLARWPHVGPMHPGRGDVPRAGPVGSPGVPTGLRATDLAAGPSVPEFVLGWPGCRRPRTPAPRPRSASRSARGRR